MSQYALSELVCVRWETASKILFKKMFKSSLEGKTLGKGSRASSRGVSLSVLWKDITI